MLSRTTFWPLLSSSKIEDIEDEDDLAVSNPDEFEAEDDKLPDLRKLGEAEAILGLKVEVGTRSGGG